VHGGDDPTTFMCRMSWKSGSLNLLEPSGPHRACYGTPHYQPLGPSDDHIDRKHAAVTDLTFGRADLATGGLAITSLLLVAVECISSYFMSGIKAFVPCPQPVSCLHKISQIFALSAWLGISFVLAFVNVSFLYLAEARPNKHIH